MCRIPITAWTERRTPASAPWHCSRRLSSAGFPLERLTAHSGGPAPPAGYLEGVRELCTKHGILLICDEVMSGFGRTGEWFAIDHWKVVPDMITMAKGLTAAYV